MARPLTHSSPTMYSTTRPASALWISVPLCGMLIWFFYLLSHQPLDVISPDKIVQGNASCYSPEIRHQLQQISQRVYERYQVRLLVAIAKAPNSGRGGTDPLLTYYVSRYSAPRILRTMQLDVPLIMITYCLNGDGSSRGRATVPDRLFSLGFNLPAVRASPRGAFPPQLREYERATLATAEYIEAELGRVIHRTTWRGRFMGRWAAFTLTMVIFAALLSWLVMLEIHVHDGRPRPVWIVPFEFVLGVTILGWGYRLCLYVLGWPEAGRLWSFPLIVGLVLGVSLCSRLTTRLNSFGLTAATVVLTSAMGLDLVKIWQGHARFPFDAIWLDAFCGAVLLGAFLVSVAGLPFRWVRLLAGDTTPGYFGSFYTKVRAVDNFLWFSAGKPLPPVAGAPLPRLSLHRLFMESSFATPFWLGLMWLAFDYEVRWERDEGLLQRVPWKWVPLLYPLREMPLIHLCHKRLLPNAQRYLEEQNLIKAIETARDGLTLLERYQKTYPQVVQAPTYCHLTLLLGQALALAGQPEEAVQRLESAHDLAYGLAYGLEIPIRYQIAEVHRTHGNLSEATRSYELAFSALHLLLSQLVREDHIPTLPEIMKFIQNRSPLTLMPGSMGTLFDFGPYIRFFRFLDANLAEVAYRLSRCLRQEATRSQIPVEQAALLARAEEAWGVALTPPLRRANTSNTVFIMIQNAQLRLRLRAFLDRIDFHELSEEAYSAMQDTLRNWCVFDERRTVQPSDAVSVAPVDEVYIELHTSVLGWLEKYGATDLLEPESTLLPEDPSPDTLWRILRDDSLNDDIWAYLWQQGCPDTRRLTLEWLNRPQDWDALDWAWGWLVQESPEWIAFITDLLRQEAMDRRDRAPIASGKLLKLALSFARMLGQPERIAEVCVDLGVLGLERGRYSAALGLGECARDLADEMQHPNLQQSSHQLMGQAYLALRRPHEASRHLGCAIEALETVRSRLLETEGRLAFTGSRHDLYSLQVEAYVADKQPLLALEIVERSKSRTLVELLGNHSIHEHSEEKRRLNLEDKRISQEYNTLRRDLTMLERRLRLPSALVGSQSQAPRSRTLQSEYEACLQRLQVVESEVKQIDAQIALRYPQWAALRGASPPPFDAPDQSDDLKRQLQRATEPLGQRCVALEYFVTDALTYIFVVPCWPEANVSLFTSALDYELLKKLEEATFWHAMHDPKERASQTPVALEMLYAHLIAPVREELNRLEANHLLIVPHAGLHSLPFQALYTHDAGERRYLIQDFTCTTLHSLSTLNYLDTQQQGRPLQPRNAFVVGNPKQADPEGDLPGAEAEARAVAALFQATPVLHQAATPAAVQSGAPTADVIHIACHGAFIPGNVLESHLSLCDGVLSVDAIMKMSLCARLVTLSACQTGMHQILPGDELLGMTRAWLYAGAPSVLASLWKADDTATQELMRHFYSLWSQGLSKAHALQQAQVRIIEDGWEHPYYWAAFTLIGHPC